MFSSRCSTSETMPDLTRRRGSSDSEKKMESKEIEGEGAV
jgi:hypothetical protein